MGKEESKLELDGIFGEMLERVRVTIRFENKDVYLLVNQLANCYPSEICNILSDLFEKYPREALDLLHNIAKNGNPKAREMAIDTLYDIARNFGELRPLKVIQKKVLAEAHI